MNIKKDPVKWTAKDLYDAALLLKENPNDAELKQQFLNIIPETGSSFNKQLYILLMDGYQIHKELYGANIEMDDFMQIMLMYISETSFSNWDPSYSLATYVKILLRPNSLIGRALLKQEPSSVSIEAIEAFEETMASLLPDEYIVPDFTDESINNAEYKKLIKAAYPVLPISREDYALLLAIEGRYITGTVTDYVNHIFGTTYTKKQLQKKVGNLIRRLKYHEKEIKAFISAWKSK